MPVDIFILCSHSYLHSSCWGLFQHGGYNYGILPQHMAPVIIRMIFFGFGLEPISFHMFSLFRRVLGLGFFPNVSQYIKDHKRSTVLDPWTHPVTALGLAATLAFPPCFPRKPRCGRIKSSTWGAWTIDLGNSSYFKPWAMGWSYQSLDQTSLVDWCLVLDRFLAWQWHEGVIQPRSHAKPALRGLLRKQWRHLAWSSGDILVPILGWKLSTYWLVW